MALQAGVPVGGRAGLKLGIELEQSGGPTAAAPSTVTLTQSENPLALNGAYALDPGAV